MTEPSTPARPATSQAKPHVTSTWLCMVRFQRLRLKSLSDNKIHTTAVLPAFSVAPSIEEGSQAVSAPVNKSAVLECVVNGVPPPQVTWRKHGAILAGNNPRCVNIIKKVYDEFQKY